MTISLTRRSVKGSALTAADHDANLDSLEVAIERAFPPDNAVHISDFGDNLFSAISGTPVGGTLLLDAKVYNGNGVTATSQVTRNDITIRGARRPRYADNGNSLVHGTVIKGGLHIKGNNITLENLGFDTGPAYVAEIGSTLNSFQMIDQAAPFFNVRILNCIALNNLPTDSTHCYVIVNADGLVMKDIEARNAIWGLVLKTKRTYVENLRTIDVGRSGLHIKSESGVLAQDIRCDNIYIENTDPAKLTISIAVYTLTDNADIDGLQFNNIFVRGYETAFNLQTSSGFKVRNVCLSNLIAKGFTTRGLLVNPVGAVSDIDGVQISNVQLAGTSGQPMRARGVNMNISNVHAVDSASQADGVLIGGNYMAQNIASIFGTNPANLSGITVEPTASLGGGQLGLHKGNLTTNPL